MTSELQACREALSTMTAERDKLREGGAAVFKLVEDNDLVRNIENDGSPNWSLQALRVVQALQKLQVALEPTK